MQARLTSANRLQLAKGSVSSSVFQREITTPTEMMNGTRRLRGGGHLA